jgi:hypothetical protein
VPWRVLVLRLGERGDQRLFPLRDGTDKIRRQVRRLARDARGHGRELNKRYGWRVRVPDCHRHDAGASYHIPESQDYTMNRQILDGLVRTANIEWVPLVENGVDTRGISVKGLRTDQVSGRALSFLLRFEPNATYPYHNHPAG